MATPPTGAATGAHAADPAGHRVDQGRTGSARRGQGDLRSFGSELKAFYLTMGRYDIVAISEAPDDEAVAKVALAIGSAGNVTTETLRAFTEDDDRQIVAALP